MRKILFILFIIFLLICGIFIYFDLNQNKIKFQEVNILIKKDDFNYRVVSNEEEFLNAMDDKNIKIIDIMNDLNLGYLYLKNNNISSKYLLKHNDVSMNPILIENGVSKLVIKKRDGLIITSSNGSRILHSNIVIENSKNIKIDNIEIDGLWEWDEKSKAEFDINDWDAITIKNSSNILIDHITFHKVYDGITDIKNSNNITIRNCKLESIDIKNDEFFNSQFEELENNKEKYSMYQFLRDEVGLSIEQVRQLSSYQYKLFLIGPKDFGEKNKNIVIHDNMFLNVKTRIPQARNSSVLFYNNYIDSSNIRYDIISKSQKEMINNSEYQKLVHLGTYGIISIQRSYVVSKNNIFNGVDYPYTSGREHEYKNMGIIIIKEDKNKLSHLKERLERNAGVQKNHS